MAVRASAVQFELQVGTFAKEFASGIIFTYILHNCVVNDFFSSTAVQQSDFQQTLADNFEKGVNYPKNVEIFIEQCDIFFFEDQSNFIKALQPTEVCLD